MVPQAPEVQVQPTQTQVESQPAVQALERVPSVNLSVDQLNPVTPQDVLQEIQAGYGGMGGGEDPCLGNYPTPTIKNSDFQNLQRIGFIEVYVCGLPANSENVNLQMILPDQTSKSYQDTSGHFYINIELIDPVGQYHLIFSGNGWTTDEYLTVTDIHYPGLTSDDNGLVLKFLPNEKVRLFVYQTCQSCGVDRATLVGWKYYQVDSNGLLRINFSDTSYFYIAIGDISGEVAFSARDVRSHQALIGKIMRSSPVSATSLPIGNAPSLNVYNPLPDCASSRIHLNDNVGLENGVDYISIRSTPDTHPSNNIIGKILPGDQAQIIDGPICNYGWILWKIKRTSDGMVGWVAEFDGNSFWLVPQQ